jgi:hypothetical protein
MLDAKSFKTVIENAPLVMPAPGLIFVGGGKGKKAAIKAELVISTAS